MGNSGHSLSAAPVGQAPWIIPRLLRIADAARYLSATTWFVETMIREKVIPSLIVGKRRVVDVRDLDEWIDNEKARSVVNESGVDIAA